MNNLQFNKKKLSKNKFYILLLLFCLPLWSFRTIGDFHQPVCKYEESVEVEATTPDYMLQEKPVQFKQEDKGRSIGKN